MRTNYCGLINEQYLDQTVTVKGWVHRRRDHGGVIFIDLRDREGIVQVVIDQPDFGLVAGEQQRIVHRRGAGDLHAPATEQRAHAGEDFRVVVHAQHTQAGQGVAGQGAASRRGAAFAQLAAARDHDGEHAAVIHCTARIQFVLQQAGDALADRQPQAQAALAPVERLLVAVELVVDLPHVVFGDAGSGVPDLQRDLVAAYPHADHDTAFARVSQRVGQEVLQYPAQQAAVAAHRAGARVHVHAQAAAGGPLPTEGRVFVSVANRDKRTVVGLAKLTSNEHFAYDAYRRFIAMFSDVVMEIPKSEFEPEAIKAKIRANPLLKHVNADKIKPRILTLTQSTYDGVLYDTEAML